MSPRPIKFFSPGTISLQSSDHQDDHTSLHMVGSWMDCYMAIPARLGQETVTILLGNADNLDDQYNGSHNRFASTFMIHKQLLCSQSRHFNSSMGRPLDKEMLAETLLAENKYHEIYGTDWQEYAPPGYVPSWITWGERLWTEAESQNNELSIDSSRLDDIISLPTERPEVFSIFIQWLYTQKLVVDNLSSISREHACVVVYALSERLDIPLLRHECYHEIRESYNNILKLPDTKTVATAMSDCSAGSMLRRYFIALFAHAVMSQVVNESKNTVLDDCPQFATEVAHEIMSCLRAGEENKPPYENGSFDVDDSDSDFESDTDSSESESDCVMSDYGSEDSAFDKMVEKKMRHLHSDNSETAPDPELLNQPQDSDISQDGSVDKKVPTEGAENNDVAGIMDWKPNDTDSPFRIIQEASNDP